MKTALTEHFGIEHPVMSAGMARVSQAPLVAAVSAAGGMGCLGGVSYLADALRDEIRAIRSLTAAPFAVNLLVPPSSPDPVSRRSTSMRSPPTARAGWRASNGRASSSSTDCRAAPARARSTGASSRRN